KAPALHHQVKGPLKRGWLATGWFPMGVFRDRTTAARAGRTGDQDMLGRFGFQLAGFRLSLHVLLDGLAGPHIHALTLVVEVGAVVDELVVGVDELPLPPLAFVREPVEVLYPEHVLGGGFVRGACPRESSLGAGA